jgi:thioesterase domain-containing protein
MSRPEVAKPLSPAKRELLRRVRLEGADAAPADDSGPIALRPGTSPPALVLVHPVGGAIFSYAALTAALRTSAPVYGFADEHDPAPEPSAQRIQRLASRYLSQLREALIPRPWVLGGWSFGGVVAYEIARQDGQASHVVLLDAAYVSEEEAATPPPESEIRRWFARDVARLAGIPPERVDVSSDEEVEELLARTGAEVGLEADEIRERYRLFAANSHALLAYRPAPYDGAATLVLAEESPDVTDAWARYVSGPIDRHVIPGDHAEVLTVASAELIAPIVDDVLRKSGAE